MSHNFDLFLFLAVTAIVLYCFLEKSLMWGFISLAVGIVILLGWVQYRTKIFS